MQLEEVTSLIFQYDDQWRMLFLCDSPNVLQFYPSPAPLIIDFSETQM